MATSESGGSLLNLIKVTGPENLVHQALAPLLSGERSQANTRENLIQFSGPLGAAIVGQQQAARVAGKAWQEVARENRKRAKRGLPELPLPAQAQYSYFDPSSVLYQNAPAPAPSQPPTQPTVGLPTTPRTLEGWVDLGARIAEYVAYFRELFGGGGGRAGQGGGVIYTIPGGEMAPSPYQTVIGGSNVPYLMTPSPATGGDGFLAGAGSLASGIGSIISAIRGGQSTSMPGGAMALGNYNMNLGLLDNLIGTGNSGLPGASCRVGGVYGMPNARGGTTWWRKAGVPLLWSGDKAACRRVRKAGGGRRRSGGC